MPRYRLRQLVISIGSDFTIEDEQGRPVYFVDGAAFSLHGRYDLKDMQGNTLVTIAGQFSIPKSMTISRGNQPVARVAKELALFAASFDVALADGTHLGIAGDILGHEYAIRRGAATIAQVSKQWFSLGDTYGIDIVAGEDEPLLLALAVAIDDMTHDK
jgi:uncharacterized protein YxjI